MRALITGITGQDGSYLAEFLLRKGYEVWGVMRRASSARLGRIAQIADRLRLVEGDMLDQMSLVRAVEVSAPDEVYHLAAQSFVGASWGQPVLTGDITGQGAVRMLEAVRSAAPRARFYQASSSEMFGKVSESPQNEHTVFYPRSPYGAAKAFAHHMVVNYRESHGMYAVSGILFNHESPRRGIEFVTRKIAHGVAQVAAGHADTLVLGNLTARRDWGYAPDYVEAMWLMLQQPTPEDYVIATGKTHSVQEFCERAFAAAGLDWQKHVRFDGRFARPAEVDLLCGDAEKAHRQLDWAPKCRFEGLVDMMVEAEMDALGGVQ